jgi:membrane-associated phospholipid phosphatase
MTGHAYSIEALGQRPRARADRSRIVAPFGVAVACLLALVVVWACATHVGALRVRDASALHDLASLNRPKIESVGNFMLHLLEPLLFTIWGTALVLIALARDRPRIALVVAVAMAAAPLTSETLKPLLAHPHVMVDGTRIGPGSWPSGHATAALTLALCAVLVAPASLRKAVATAGGAYALAVGVLLLVLGWHMPSDVLGGYLMATLWVALLLAALRISERLWPSHPREPAGTPSRAQAG